MLAAANCAVTPAAFAQASQAVPTVVVSAAASDGRLDARMATGSNLDLSRFDTPASVDIVTRRQLEERGDISLVDAITRAPGLSGMPHPGNGGSSLAARGFTDTVSVMRLYDGMRQYGGVGLTFPFDTWSVERIEVLRGPASVIHGEGAIGAVVNIVPRQPSRGAIQNEVQAALGTEGTRRLAFGSGGALDERWSYRFDAGGERSDGWVDRGDYSNRAVSGALRLDLSPDFYLKLAAAHGRQKPMRYFGTPLVDGRQLDALRHKNFNVGDALIDYDDTWVDLLAHWKPNAATTVRSRLYTVDSERHWRNAEAYLYSPGTRLVDRSDNTEILHDQSQIGNTTDVTLRGALFGLENQVSGGFDINASSFRHTNNTYVGSSPSVDPFDPVPGSFASAVPTLPRYRARAGQFALFLEDRLALSSRWSLLAGVRYDHADISRRNLVAGVLAYDKTFTNVGWRLGSVFQVTPALALYGQYARAADPVGALLLLSPANSDFDSATGRQFEIGVKGVLPEKRGEWTLAAYDISKSNLLTRDAADPARSIQVGRRSSRGIEATLDLVLAPGWRLEANASLLRARFDDFSEAAGGALVSRVGNTPPDVPRRLANAWLSWDFAPQWSASAGLRHVGARHADNANLLRMPAYSTTDLSLRWKAAPRTTLVLRASNLFDKRYYATAYYTPTQWLVGPDRRVELVLNQRF
ncbi:TonB-dependent receptor [Massilia sp.]|uniref:TonB-dependent receptor n=1 Tax=Massilia sp. TaxID=1882437 RepID=UPI00289A2A84|nr:TonB-dependent receptor [Massilia sp.]